MSFLDMSVCCAALSRGHAEALSLALPISILAIGLAIVTATIDGLRRRRQSES
jgi:hypothetical protein